VGIELHVSFHEVKHSEGTTINLVMKPGCRTNCLPEATLISYCWKLAGNAEEDSDAPVFCINKLGKSEEWTVIPIL
jgi:hypothetical protein